MRVCGVKPQLHLDNGRSFSMLCKDGVIPIEENSQAKRRLSKDVFGRRTAPGGVPFFVLICLVATKSVLLSVFTRMQTIWTGLLSKNTESRLPVDMPRSKTSLLGLHDHQPPTQAFLGELVGRDEKRAPLKTPAWEATRSLERHWTSNH